MVKPIVVMDCDVGRASKKNHAPSEDRTRDLQITLMYVNTLFDYETDALPTALSRHLMYYVRVI